MWLDVWKAANIPVVMGRFEKADPPKMHVLVFKAVLYEMLNVAGREDGKDDNKRRSHMKSK